jgi:class 3 adenylate cyclase
MRKRTYIIGFVTGLILFIGIVFKVNNFPGARLFIGLGIPLFVLGFSVSYLFDKLSLESKLKIKIAHIIQYLAMLFMVFSAMFYILGYPGSGPLSVIGTFFLIVYFVFFSRHTEGRKLMMQKDRQLASILFTDIVGFTKMMGEDEDKTLQALDRNRSIQKRIIRKHRGRWIKEMGDGAIAIFFSASEAINCSMAIQKEVQEKEEFKLSMGVHVSEILFTDNDIFGDGVNVASRIASMAEANEIWFSATVFENIRNREDIEIESMGPQQLKNVVYEVNLYKIVV